MCSCVPPPPQILKVGLQLNAGSMQNPTLHLTPTLSAFILMSCCFCVALQLLSAGCNVQIAGGGIYSHLVVFVMP